MNNKMLRVLIVHNHYQILGGEDTVVANEKKLLEENGHEVYLYTRTNKELYSMSNIKKALLSFNMVFNFTVYKEISELIRINKIDIVHVHNTLIIISPAVYYAAKRYQIPVVQTMHNFRMLCPGGEFFRNGSICEECIQKGIYCALKNRCYRNSLYQTFACVLNTMIHRHSGIYKKIFYICLTEFNKEKLLQLNKKKMVVDANKIYIKPNFTYSLNNSISHSIVRTYYLYIGRIEDIKGINLITEAFSKMPDKKLVVVGTGSKLDSLKSTASQNVEFLGFLKHNELSKVLTGAKAVIVASQWYETFGMIVTEAYAAAVPVIVGDIGNVSALVDEKRTGLKFIYNSIDSLRSTIYEFEHLNQYTLSSNAYKKYMNEFSPDINYKLLIDIYYDVINKNNMGRLK